MQTVICRWQPIAPMRRNLKDRVIVTEVAAKTLGWIQVEHRDGSWTDVLGNSTPDNLDFRGLILELPKGFVSEDKSVKGQAGLIWQ